MVELNIVVGNILCIQFNCILDAISAKRSIASASFIYGDLSFQKSVTDAMKCLADVFSSLQLSFLQTSPNGGCFVAYLR